MAEKLKIYGVYFIAFLLFFIQIPLNGCLAGKTDCWWHLGTFLDFENRLHDFINHVPSTTSYFPAKALWLFGEPSFGVGGIYVFIHSFVHNYIWSFYLLYVILFSFTAYAFYLLAGQFVSAVLPRLAGGFFFTMSNFTLGHLDHHNTFFWAIAFLCVLSFYRYLSGRSLLKLYWVFVLWGLQIYFSTTIFIYLSIWIFILALINYKEYTNKRLLPHLILAGCILVVLISPLLLLYVFNPEIKNAYNPSLFANGNVVSNLWLRDFIRFLPDNIFYSKQTDIDFDLLYNIKCAAPGIVLLILFFLGLKILPRSIFYIALVALILALGSELKIGPWSIPMPMKLYYSNFPNFPFLRTPVRAYFMVHWLLCMAAVYGLNRFNGSDLRRASMVLFVLVLFICENVPAHLSAAKADKLIIESRHISDFISKGETGAVLHLPSELFPTFPIRENMYGMNVIGREYFYSFFQTVYRRNTINGSAGYIPKTRIRVNDVLQFRSEDDFKKMLKQYEIKYVLLHKDLMLDTERKTADTISHYPFLHLQQKIDNCYVYSVE